MRLASLTPSNTEIVAFLGCVNRLVGVDSFSDWPPGVEGVVDLGPDLQIDVDELVGLEPDVVLSSLSVPGMEEVVEAVEDAGLLQVVVRPRSLEGIVESVVEVSRVLGVPQRGRRLAGAMREEMDRLEELVKDVEPLSVHWEWWPKPVIVAGGVGWMGDVLALAGARNAYAFVEEESQEVPVDVVERVDPDAIALCWQGTLQRVQDAERVVSREGYGGLRAVMEGRIVEAPEALFGRPGPRVLEGARWLAARLHPGLRDVLGEAYAWVPGDLRLEGLT